jgi:hypothetical protein
MSAALPHSHSASQQFMINNDVRCLNCHVHLDNRRGGKCFAWDDARAMLCVAVQLLHYDGSDFVELKEVAVGHSPVAMQWLGGNTVCVVCKSQ